MPSINRNFTAYLGMLPGVIATISIDSFGADSIRVNGQGTQNVNYTLDGVGNNDNFNGGNGGAQARMPVEAVQEFQLLTSQFDAEFGSGLRRRRQRGVEAGHQQFHGSAFLFDQNENLTARDYFAEKRGLEKPETQQQQWGGNARRPDRQGQAPLLRQPRAYRSEAGVDHQQSCAAGPEPHRLHARQRVELDGRVRPPDQRRQHLGGPLAARDVAAEQPDPRQTNYTLSRAEDENDADWTIVGTMNSVIGTPR